MTAAGDEEARRAGRARTVALFRYSLIREAADPALSTRQRGRLVRELATREHAGPFGEPVTVSRPSLDRWIRACGPAGSTRWPRRAARSPCGPRPRCSPWPRR
jgi:putative transposase